MFGNNDNTQQSNDDPAMLDNVKQLVNEHDSQSTTQPPTVTAVPAPTSISTTAPASPLAFNDPASATAPEPHVAVAEPAQGFSSSPIVDPEPVDPNPASDPTSDAGNSSDSQQPEPAAVNNNVAAPEPAVVKDDSIAADTTTTSTADPEKLAGMKQQALDHLEPLVDHLDQSPEETFKTTMMMIQANDNHSLLDKALDTARKIEDDKARAQALLDIINEINYFSQDS